MGVPQLLWVGIGLSCLGLNTLLAQEQTSATPEWVTVPSAQLELNASSREFDEDELRTDRDAFTPVPTTARSGQAIVEASYPFVDNRGAAAAHTLPTLLLRAGVSERAEFRLGWAYDTGGAFEATGGIMPGTSHIESTESSANLLFGTKVRLVDPDGWQPATSLIVAGLTPTSGPDNTTDLTTTAIWEWDLERRRKLSLALAYNAASESADHYNQWAPSVVFRVPVTKRWEMHAEYFSIVTEGREQELNRHYVSPGTHFSITPNFEIGVRLIWGITPDSDRFVCNAGLGVRF